MFDTKLLALTVLAAALVGILVEFLASSLFPGWADAGPWVRGAVIGALCGPIYPLLARRSGR